MSWPKPHGTWDFAMVAWTTPWPRGAELFVGFFVGESWFDAFFSVELGS